MESLTIELPESLRRYIDDRVSAGEFETPSEYFRALIERDRRRAERSRLESLALEGLASGEPIDMDEAWWAKKYAEFDERFGTAE